MVKFIGNWMFASRIWGDAEPTPTVINLQEIQSIDQMNLKQLGGEHVVISLKRSTSPLPIEGNIIEVLAAFQKHLQTMY